jgi:MFS family permease
MIGTLARFSTFSALRHHNFRVFWTGMLGSQVGTWMQSTAQSYLVWQLTGSALATSLVTLVFSLPSTLLALVGGVVADRMDRRRLIMGTQTVFLLQAVALTVLTFSGHIRIWQIYALALVNGTVMAFDSPARQSMIPSLVPRGELSNAIALNSTVFNASRVVGPPLAGLVYAAFGPGWCFAINAVSFLAILYSLSVIRLTPAPADIVRTHLWEDLREGLGYARSHQVVRTLLVLVALVGTLAFVYLVLMPVVASRVLGGGPAENGYLLGAAGVGATVGALAVAALRPVRPGRFIFGFGYAGSAALVAMAFSTHLLLSMVLTAAVAGCVMAVLATCNATIQAYVSDSLRGRIMSIYTLALIGSGPANAAIAGLLGNALGAPATIGLSGLAMGLAVAWIASRNRHVVELDLSTPGGPGDPPDPAAGRS